jgi:small-conductance mechanosensitive channel
MGSRRAAVLGGARVAVLPLAPRVVRIGSSVAWREPQDAPSIALQLEAEIPMDTILQTLQQDTETVLAVLPRVLAGLLLILTAVVLGRVIGRWVERAIHRTQPEVRRLPLVAVRIAVLLLLLVPATSIALSLMGLRSAAFSLLATGGVAAVVFGLAFQKVGENIIAGLALSTARSFDIGDLIEISGHRGKVEAITLRSVHIRTADACDVFIPTAEVFSTPLMNFTLDGLRRLQFTVGVDYGDDLPGARAVVLDAIRGVHGVLPNPEPEVRVAELSDNFVLLEGTLWANYRDQERPLARVRTESMERSVAGLLEAGFTVSSNVATAVEIRRPPE